MLAAVAENSWQDIVGLAIIVLGFLGFLYIMTKDD